jgi:hypothetical protein
MENLSDGAGGSITSDHAVGEAFVFMIEDSLFTRNIAGLETKAAGSYGGAVLLANSSISTPMIRGCTFHGNSAAHGGAVAYSVFLNDEHRNVPKLVIEDSEFDANIADTTIEGAQTEGGALHGQRYHIVNSTFTRNTAYTGGVLDMGRCAARSSCEVLIESSTFEGNSATMGGVVYSAQPFDDTVSEVQILDSRFVGNTARDAGALEIQGGLLRIEGTDFEGNRAERGYAAMSFTGPDLQVLGSRFLNNVWHRSSSPTVGLCHGVARDIAAG